MAAGRCGVETVDLAPVAVTGEVIVGLVAGTPCRNGAAPGVAGMPGRGPWVIGVRLPPVVDGVPVVAAAGRAAAGLKDFAAPALVAGPLAFEGVTLVFGSTLSAVVAGRPETCPGVDGFADTGVDFAGVRTLSVLFGAAAVAVVPADDFLGLAAVLCAAVEVGLSASVGPPLTAWRSRTAISSSTVLRLVLTLAPSCSNRAITSATFRLSSLASCPTRIFAI
jgi:hypothetical protein